MSPMNNRLLRPLAKGFNPKSIDGLSAWYDATVASSITLTSGFVSQWNDLSGSDLHLTQSVEANRPGTGTINGKTAVDFDGSNDLMQVSADVFPGTLFVVGSLDNIAVSGLVATARDSAPNSVNAFWIASTEWRLVGFDADAASGFAHSGGTAVVGRPVLATVLHGSSNVSRVDGSPLAGTTNVTGGNIQGITVGARDISGSRTNFFNGQIGEVLLFNRVLTTSEVQRVEGYLAWKWGLEGQLPTNHPYAYSFPGFGSQPQPSNAESVDWINAVIAAGSSVNTATANAVDQFVSGCKSDGIWDAIKSCCVLCGPDTLAGALVPLVGSAPTNNNFVAGDYNRLTGLVGDGSTTYLDLNYAFTSALQNDRHCAVWVSSPQVSGSHAYFGSANATQTFTGRTQLVAANGAEGNLISRMADETSHTSATVNNVAGLQGLSRQASDSYTRRADETNQNISVSSLSGDETEMWVFARNVTGSELQTNARLSFYSIGEALDLEALDTRVSALITAIGNS